MSAMIPSIDWHRAAEEFGRAQGRQVLLCAVCAGRGDVTPPDEVVVSGGVSLCLTHFSSSKHDAT